MGELLCLLIYLFCYLLLNLLLLLLLFIYLLFLNLLFIFLLSIMEGLLARTFSLNWFALNIS